MFLVLKGKTLGLYQQNYNVSAEQWQVWTVSCTVSCPQSSLNLSSTSPQPPTYNINHTFHNQKNTQKPLLQKSNAVNAVNPLHPRVWLLSSPPGPLKFHQASPTWSKKTDKRRFPTGLQYTLGGAIGSMVIGSMGEFRLCNLYITYKWDFFWL